MQETRIPSLGQEDPLKREWQPTPVFFLGKFHGQGDLMGYRPGGHKELDMTEGLSMHAQVYVYVIFSIKKRYPVICNNLLEPRGHYA